MKLTIDRVKAVNLTNQLTKMSLMGNEIYFLLSDEYFESNVFLPTKDVVKCSKISMSSVFETTDKLSKPLKLGFFDGSKVKGILNMFELQSLRGEISYYDEGDCFMAEHLILKDNTLKITLSCLDPALGFTSMTVDQIGVAFNNDSKVYSFKLGAIDLAKISRLNSIDMSKLFSIYSDKEGVHIKGDNYDIIVDDSVKDEHDEVLVFKTFIPKIDQESYNVTVCQGVHNKILLDSVDTETRIALNLALRAD